MAFFLELHALLRQPLSLSLSPLGGYLPMRVREWIRVVAIIVVACGFLCLPITGDAVAAPKHYMSVFTFLADSGSLVHVAAILLAAGAGLFGISFLCDRE